jgi:hypothetical protein
MNTCKIIYDHILFICITFSAYNCPLAKKKLWSINEYEMMNNGTWLNFLAAEKEYLAIFWMDLGFMQDLTFRD